MKISYDYKKSAVHKSLVRLFVDDKMSLFKESVSLGLLNRFNSSKLSQLFLFLSFICLWYESFFSQIGIGWIENINLGVILLVLSLLFCDKKRIISARSSMYLLFFVLSTLASGLWAAINGLETGMIISGISLYIQLAIAFVVASTFKEKYKLIDIILLSSLPLLSVGIFQGLWGGATSKLWVSTLETLVDSRAYGFLGSPNVLGSVVMITMIAATFAWLEKRKWYYLGYLALAATTIILTFSRGAWFGLATGIVTALLILNWRYVLVAPLGMLALLVPSIRQRLLVAFSQQYLVDAAIDGRVWSLNDAIEIFKTSPLLGTGPGSYGGQTAIYYDSPVYLKGIQNGYVALAYTDNQWLQILTQTGIVGIFFVSCFFVSVFTNNLRQYMRSRKYLNLGVLAATVAIIINGMFANIWEFGAVSVLAGTYLGLGVSNES